MGIKQCWDGIPTGVKKTAADFAVFLGAGVASTATARALLYENDAPSMIEMAVPWTLLGISALAAIDGMLRLVKEDRNGRIDWMNNYSLIGGAQKLGGWALDKCAEKFPMDIDMDIQI